MSSPCKTTGQQPSKKKKAKTTMAEEKSEVVPTQRLTRQRSAQQGIPAKHVMLAGKIVVEQPRLLIKPLSDSTDQGTTSTITRSDLDVTGD